MTESEVVAAFAAWLERDGWTIGPGPDRHLDLYATRADDRLHAEAKGATQDKGIDADILWGQILRRMGEFGMPGARYAVVVPDTVKWHALRVPAKVRTLLGIEVYLVAADGSVARADA
ncbi:hypothetical protein CU254_21040 [Amycolatopsis sp. AA4]|uniref:hypothetical protein n=1 Tax=Actinomycetes TaxID=1760 RepID=UPI0001B5606B|nr:MULTISPECIES: hypothetical protein [Actinomycetes]ATY12665.1 hypothetical protein CU254_21040 [Amycolatopsis sp. AA4]EFL08468.1 predicted protein [Streptomyces sp. AA4]